MLRCHHEGEDHAAWNGRSRSDGREHGAPLDGQRSPMRRLRRVPRERNEARGRGRDRREHAGGIRAEARQAARDLADGARRARRFDDRAAARAARTGRYPDRRRQLELPRRHSSRQRDRAQRNSLRRRRHERRRVGSRARLLHDDRRREAGRRPPRSHLPHFGAQHRQRVAHGESSREQGHRRARLPSLRARGRRPLREDGPQRHRVRHHGRLRRGPEHLASRQRRQGRALERRRDQPAEESRALPVRHGPR